MAEHFRDIYLACDYPILFTSSATTGVFSEQLRILDS